MRTDSHLAVGGSRPEPRRAAPRRGPRL